MARRALQLRGEGGLQRRGGGRRVHELADLDGGGSRCGARAGWCGATTALVRGDGVRPLQVLGDGGLVRGELRDEGRREPGGGGHGREPLRKAKSSGGTSKDATHAAETRSPWPPGRAAAAQQRRGRRLLRPLRRARVQRGLRSVCLGYVCQ
jgi:hypothetical protein